MKPNELKSLEILAHGQFGRDSDGFRASALSITIIAIDKKGQRHTVKEFCVTDDQNARDTHQAHYMAIDMAVSYANDFTRRVGKYPITIKSPSKLAINQINGTMKCKSDDLIPLRDMVNYHKADYTFEIL